MHLLPVGQNWIRSRSPLHTRFRTACLRRDKYFSPFQEFNKGLFDYLIATDAIKVGPSKAKKKSSKEEPKSQEKGEEGESKEVGEEAEGEAQQPRKKKRRLGDQEFGVVRGIDFKNVRTVSRSVFQDERLRASGLARHGRRLMSADAQHVILLTRPVLIVRHVSYEQTLPSFKRFCRRSKTVIDHAGSPSGPAICLGLGWQHPIRRKRPLFTQVVNFDLPDTPSGYVHRIGRTGRAGSTGTAVSLVRPDQSDLIGRVESALAASGDESEGEEEPPSVAPGSIIGEFPSLTSHAVEALRYRAEVSRLPRSALGRSTSEGCCLTS